MNRLVDQVWNKTDYYIQAQQGSLQTDHFGMVLLKKVAAEVNSILDLGCGDGTRLNWVITKNQKHLGIDISPTAIKIAQKQFPKLNFKCADIANLQLNQKFELIYSAFVLEHLQSPQKFLDQAISLLSDNGYLLLIAPNYGAPNRASPPFKGSRLAKLFKGLVGDIKALVVSSHLNWHSVEPLADDSHYHSDWDTTVEPYLGSLINYLQQKGLMIQEVSSCWEQEQPDSGSIQKAVRALGRRSFYPFWMWGPHLVVLARKQND